MPIPGPPFVQSAIPRPQSAFFHGNARSQARKIVLSMGTPGHNIVAFVKIDIQGAAAKLKGPTYFYRGPRDFLPFPLP